jgi:Predicted glycosyltransferases
VGFAEGNNRGLFSRIGEGAEYYLVLNNDAYVEPWTITKMLDVAMETGAEMIAPAVYKADDPAQVDRFGLTLTRSGAGYNRKHEFDGPLLCPSGCAALYHRDLVLDLIRDPEGFFDRRFEAYAEDLDTGLRALARGYRVAFAAGATVLHEGGATFGPSSSRSYFLRHRNTMWSIAKNYSAGLLLHDSVYLGLGHLASMVNAVRRRRFRAVIRGKFEGAKAWWAFRRPRAGAAKLSDPRLLDRRFWLSRL